jgi:hypothetical protein
MKNTHDPTLTGKARLSQPHRNVPLACVSPM